MKDRNKLSGLCEITEMDIATIEALHDLLLDNGIVDLYDIVLTRSRELTSKMYDAIEI